MPLPYVPTGAVPEPVVELCRRFQQAGFRAWVVGGSLRDILLDRPTGDWDLATSATPKQVMGIFEQVIPTGIDHGTVTVLFGGEPYEVTTLRGEGGYSDGRRPDRVFFIDDIEGDLARRDFTVNALAFDPLDGGLIDPFGGLADMAMGRLQTVGVASERFSEDGLRVLRAARFAATLEFQITDDTQAAMTQCLDVFAKVSPERVRDEWLKAFTARAPSRAFEVMRATGILGVTCPELMQQVGCVQNSYHAHDVWTHTMVCMDACERGPIHRLAGLLHDIGKPATRQLSDKTGDYTFYEHERVGAGIAERWLQRYRFSNHERDQVVDLVRHHLVCYTPQWSAAAVRRFIKRVTPERIDDLLALARADALAKGRDVGEELQQLEELAERVQQELAAGAVLGTRDLAISGRDVMQRLGIPPGRRIGEILEILLQQVLDEPALNQRERLLGAVDALGRGEP
ncbi:MAG: HD domain-containing protein [Myxococcales bacterium]|nr:HD domain-containing protein [Myxococcales bacterium]